MSRLLGRVPTPPRRFAGTVVARGRAARLIRHVALVFPMESAHVQDIVRGIGAFSAGEGGGWRFTTLAQPLAHSMPFLSGWQGDGVIAALRTGADARAAAELAELGIPCVNIDSGTIARDGSIPRVAVDNQAVARLAAEHLIECGLRRFAYYGLGDGGGYAGERGRGFVRRLREDGFACEAYADPEPPVDPEAIPRVTAPALAASPALAELLMTHVRGPLGVFAADDRAARRVLDGCRAAGLRVPEQVAVIGVDNDRPTCEASDPPLSSVACDWRRLGYDAAARLEALMSGRPRGTADGFIAPLGVVQRRSTDTLVIRSACVARAVAYVRQHVSEVFGVEAVLQAAGTPRRSLELAFKQALGCTPYRFITRARLARATELLATTPPRSLSEIARACGFADLRRFRLVFRREFGLSPAQHRHALHATR